MLTFFAGLAVLIMASLPQLRRRLPRPTSCFILWAGSLAGLLLILWDWRAVPFVQLWTPPYHWRSQALWLMLAACILAAAAVLPRSWIKAGLIKPFSLAVLVWTLAHLMTNGDLASVLFLLTVAGLTILRLVQPEPSGLPHSAATPARPREHRPGLHWDLAAIVLGMLIYGLLFVFHGELVGMGLSLY